MPLPTINDIQAIDPVLTNMLVGYMQSDMRFVAMRAAPALPVEKDSGTYYIFDKKYWFTDTMPSRAPGTTFERGGFGVSTATYSTLQYALSHPIPDEHRANNQTPMDLEQSALRLLAQKSLIRKERDFATTAFTTGVWGTDVAGTTNFTKWSDYASSDPVGDVLTGKRTISQATGSTPNQFIMGEIVYDKLLNHPDIIDRLKYTQSATMSGVEGALAAIFGVDQLLVALAIYNTANEGQTASMSAIIDDDALLIFTQPGATMMTPTAMKTFAWNGGGGTGQATMVRDDMTDSDLVKHKEQWDIKVVASDVGYFFSDAVD